MAAPTTEILLPGIISRCTEFVWDRKESRWLTGDCGPDALAEGVAWADQVLCDAGYVAGMYDGMRTAGECDVNGPSSIGQLEQAANRLKLPGVERIGFAQPLSGWQAWFTTRVGQKALIMETSNGQALNDYLTGKGENATHLQYHYILLVGYHPGGYSAHAKRVLPQGWWAADGDNFDVGNVLQFYPAPVLAASAPCAALSFGGRVAPKGTPVDTGFYGLTVTADPQVWHCAQFNTDLAHGFRLQYIALQGAFGTGATEVLGLPLTNEYKDSAGLTRQDFERGSLRYDGSKPNPWMIYHAPVGLELAEARKQNADQAAQLATLTAELAKATADLAAAQQSGATYSALSASLKALEPTLTNVEGALGSLDGTASGSATLEALATLNTSTETLTAGLKTILAGLS